MNFFLYFGRRTPFVPCSDYYTYGRLVKRFLFSLPTACLILLASSLFLLGRSFFRTRRLLSSLMISFFFLDLDTIDRGQGTDTFCTSPVFRDHVVTSASKTIMLFWIPGCNLTHEVQSYNGTQYSLAPAVEGSFPHLLRHRSTLKVFGSM